MKKILSTLMFVFCCISVFSQPLQRNFYSTNLAADAVLSGAITTTSAGVATLASGIDAAKIADGSVSSTEFQKLDGVTATPTASKIPIAGASGLLDGWTTLGATVSESELALTDVTTANATTSAHGFLPKLNNAPSYFMNGIGGWGIPPGTTLTAAAMNTAKGGDIATNQNATLTSALVIGDGARGVKNSTGGAVPANFDGTATTFAQVNSLSGTANLSDSHLSANVPLLNSVSQTFTGTNNFTGEISSVGGIGSEKFGHFANAVGIFSVAYGASAQATNDGSGAFGNTARAWGYGTTAIGASSKATNSFSIAMGVNSFDTKSNQFALPAIVTNIYIGGINYTFPTSGGSAGQVLTNDGADHLNWATLAAGGSITGTDTRVLFFDGANNPAGDAGMTYNKTTDALTIGGDIISGGSIESSGGLNALDASGAAQFAGGDAEIDSSGNAAFRTSKVKAGGSANSAGVGGVIEADSADHGTVGTGEDTLWTYTILQNQFSQIKATIKAEYGFVLANSTSTKRIRVKVGGTQIFDTGALTISASSAFSLDVLIMSGGPGPLFRYKISGATTGASTATYAAVGEASAGADWDVGDNDLIVTGESAGVGTADDDVVLKLVSIRQYPDVP